MVDLREKLRNSIKFYVYSYIIYKSVGLFSNIIDSRSRQINFGFELEFLKKMHKNLIF